MTGRGRTLGRRGALLLELMISVALFVLAGLWILSAASRSLDSVSRARERNRGLDLARSALARIEAGLASVDELNGPVLAYDEASPVTPIDGEAPDVLETSDVIEGAEAAAFDSNPNDAGDPTGWELEVSTEPSAFAGLAVVRVVAKRVNEGTGLESERVSLTQLIRLGGAAENSVGEQDRLMRDARIAPLSGNGGGR